MAKYASYSDYKDTGVEWLPPLPENWDVQRNKAMFSLIKKPVGNKSSDYKLLSLTLTGIIPRDLDNLKGKMPAEFDTYQEVKRNDLVFCLFDVDETPRTIGLSQLEGMVTGAYSVYRCLPKVWPDYVFYYYFHLDEFKGLRPFYTGLRKVVRPETFSNIKMPAPPVEEQKAIAAFLDHETAKIDRLIVRQERLIELLKEKRQAVISHAVTKGLNPDAPMKDSGVEWLGEVPAHWVCKSYRYATRVYRGKFGHRPRNDPEFYDGDYPFIQTGDIAQAAKNISEYKQTLNEKGKSVSQKFLAGTLVMAIAANIGDTAILGFEAYAPDSVVGFKPKPDVVLEFLRYSLMAALPALQQTSTQSAQANLNIDRIGSVKGVFPPVEEQTRIIAHLDSLLEHYGLLENKAKEGIALMQEHRIALISAVVTGKIDVRGWQKPDTELEETATAVSA